MSLVVAGMSYRTAPAEARELAAVPASAITACLNSVVDFDGVKEAALLSTCNRIELVMEAKTDRHGADAGKSFFRLKMGEAFEDGYLYTFRGVDAARHILRVACSLESQVLGEAQILGQVRFAHDAACQAGTCGEVLDELLKRALRLGKQVRSETEIGADSVSLSTVAYKTAKQAVGDLAPCRVMLVGAGEMARLAASYLAGEVAELIVTNRTFERAEAFAGECNARAVPFENRFDEAARCDIVFTMTGADEPVIGADALARARAAAGRGDAPLVLVDEALPRDVETACALLPGVRLYDLEALSDAMDEGASRRMAAVPQVEEMAAQAERSFLEWMQERLVVPTIKAIYEKGALTVEDELAHARRALAKARGQELTNEEIQVLEAYGNAVMKKILHGPTVRLRREAQTADSYYYTGAARYLFGLETFPPGTHRFCHQRSCENGGSCPMGLTGAMLDTCREREGRL